MASAEAAAVDWVSVLANEIAVEVGEGELAITRPWSYLGRRSDFRGHVRLKLTYRRHG